MELGSQARNTHKFYINLFLPVSYLNLSFNPNYFQCGQDLLIGEFPTTTAMFNPKAIYAPGIEYVVIAPTP